MTEQDRSKYLQEKYPDEMQVSIGCISVTCARAGRTDTQVARHYHLKYGFQVIRVRGRVYKFEEGVEVLEVPRIRYKGPERAHH